MVEQLAIAIDFDDTFTADVHAWIAIIGILKMRGHRVICVSARRNNLSHFRELKAALPSGVEILLSYDMPKRLYAKKEGIDVDIWIDDKPESIPSREDMERLCG